MRYLHLTVIFTAAALCGAIGQCAELISPDVLRAAVGKSLPLLTKGAVGHREQQVCMGCHSQAHPIIAITTAKLRGIEVDDKELAEQLDFITGFLKRNREAYDQGKGTGGQVDTAGYALLALELGGRKPDETTAAVTSYLLQRHRDRDHWGVSANRPPSEASVISTNYLALRALRVFGTPEQQEKIAARREQVRKWLLDQSPADTEDRVFQLLAFKELGESPERISLAAKQLLAMQRGDGGWGQMEDFESDAYATGTALYALHASGELAARDEAYQSGVRYLLSTQLPDGSWHVRSRSKPFQPYYETGFPHGKDQFISSSASSWATAAIALAIE